jgi:hypothetical protein
MQVFNARRSRDSSIGIATAYRLEGRDPISGRFKRFFSSSQHPDCLWIPPSLLFSGYRGFFHREKYGQVVNLVAHFHIVPR